MCGPSIGCRGNCRRDNDSPYQPRAGHRSPNSHIGGVRPMGLESSRYRGYESYDGAPPARRRECSRRRRRPCAARPPEFALLLKRAWTTLYSYFRLSKHSRYKCPTNFIVETGIPGGPPKGGALWHFCFAPNRLCLENVLGCPLFFFLSPPAARGPCPALLPKGEAKQAVILAPQG